MCTLVVVVSFSSCSLIPDTGLLGIYGSCAAGGESALVESMVTAFKGVASGVSDSAFTSAKNNAALAVGETSSDVAESLGSSLLFSGTASTGADFSGVTAASVAAAAKSALASPPALASLGPLLAMPGIETVKGML